MHHARLKPERSFFFCFESLVPLPSCLFLFWFLYNSPLCVASKRKNLCMKRREKRKNQHQTRSSLRIDSYRRWKATGVLRADCAAYDTRGREEEVGSRKDEVQQYQVGKKRDPGASNRLIRNCGVQQQVERL